jgi:hypothetical protein
VVTTLVKVHGQGSARNLNLLESVPIIALVPRMFDAGSRACRCASPTTLAADALLPYGA